MLHLTSRFGLGALAMGALLLLSGCATGWNVDAARVTVPTGSAFTKFLYKDYMVFVNAETRQEDWTTADFFSKKAMKAAGGTVVLPEDPAVWEVPAQSMDELVTARGKLISVLDKGGRDKVAEKSSLAQVKYDCWVEQQEENRQPDHILMCKNDFYTLLNQIEKELMGKFVVYFKFDKSSLTKEALAVIKQAAEAAKLYPNDPIVLIGHADRAGSAKYNDQLSFRRAAAVRAQLFKLGVASSRITVVGKGESMPVIQTPDGLPEAKNRRVEINLTDM